MSRVMTQAWLPALGHGSGLMLYDEVPKEKIIAELRKMAEANLKLAQAQLAAADGDFEIEVVRGVHRQTKIKTLQSATMATP